MPLSIPLILIAGAGGAGGGPGNVRSVTVTLVDSAGDPIVSETSLKWAWFDEVTPDLFAAPTDQGDAESTDASGVLTILIPNSVLEDGDTGWLIVTDSDGTTTQAPAHKAFSGPAEVAIS